MRNPARIFADMETYFKLYTVTKTYDLVNTLESTDVKVTLFEGTRFIEPIPISKNKEFIGGELEFKGKLYMVYFDRVANDQSFFLDKTKEYYISFNKKVMFSLQNPITYPNTLKLHKMPEYSGLTNSQVGMLECIFLEI
jgi:hypothetical protein